MNTPKMTIIAAMSVDRVIGQNDRIPWRYSGDFKRFKEVTMGGTLIMGRKTWESIGHPLAGRVSIVVSKTATLSGVLVAADLEIAIRLAIAQGLAEDGKPRPIWFIGGYRIYEAAMAYADEIDLTYVPDRPDPNMPGTVKFPRIDEDEWVGGTTIDHEYEPVLMRQVFLPRPKAAQKPDSKSARGVYEAPSLMGEAETGARGHIDAAIAYMERARAETVAGALTRSGDGAAADYYSEAVTSATNGIVAAQRAIAALERTISVTRRAEPMETVEALKKRDKP